MIVKKKNKTQIKCVYVYFNFKKIYKIDNSYVINIFTMFFHRLDCNFVSRNVSILNCTLAYAKCNERPRSLSYY